MKDKMKLSVNNREGTLIITIAVIFVAMCILKGELFYARSNIEAIFSNLAYDLLLACGMTFVIYWAGWTCLWEQSLRCLESSVP